MNRWLLVLVSLGLVPAAWSDEPKKPDLSPEAAMKAMTAAATPGAEHKKLEPLIGNWSYTCKVWMDASQPPMESKGTIERKWILGGRFVEEKVTGTNLDGKPGFEGGGIIGYDNAQKKYTMGWACTMGTGITTALGTADASGKTFTFQTEVFCPLRQKKISGRDELRIESNDKNVMESYETDGGKERKVMEITAVRIK